MAAPITDLGRRLFVTKFIEIPENVVYHPYDVCICRAAAELHFPNVSTESIILALSSNIHCIWSHNCCLFTRAKFIEASAALKWNASATDCGRDGASNAVLSPFRSLTLMCTGSFLARYGFSTSTELFAVRVEPFPIHSVTLGVKSQETFEWISKTGTFTTGLVVSVCQDKILIWKGDAFIAPDSPLFDSDSGFTTRMLSDLMVLDCTPLKQGILTVNTEMIVIRIPGDDNSMQPTTVEDDQPVILSDFASSMLSCNGSFLQSHLLDKKSSKKKNREESFEHLSVVVVSNFDSIVANSTCSSLQQRSYDVNNTVGMTKCSVVKNGLFDGSFVEIKVPEKPEKTAVVLGVRNHSSSDCQGTSAQHLRQDEGVKSTKTKRDKTELCVKTRTVQVKVLKEDVNLRDDCVYILPSLWFNLAANRSVVSGDADTLLLRKIQDSRHHSEDTPVTASASWKARLPVATEVHVSCIRSPNYSVNDNFSKALKDYLDIPRFVQLGDVLCVDTNVTGSRDTSGSGSVVHFKVVKILPAGYQTYLVTADDITLFQDAAVHSFIPATVPGKDQVHPSFLPRLPPGLGQYEDQLQTLILPQLRARVSCDELCASILVTGPPGCGKAAVVRSVAGQLNMHVLSVNCCYELIGDTAASVESRVRYIMHKACSCAPCVLLLRNVDALGKDHSGKNTDQRVISCYQDHVRRLLEESPDWPVVVVATTSHPTALSSDMHEGFLHCVAIEAPDEEARQLMLESLFVEVTQDSDVDTTHVAQRTAGMVLGDLHTLFILSTMAAHKRILQCYESGRRWLSAVEQQDLCLAGFSVSQCDVNTALDQLQTAHSQAISAPKIPNVTWADVGGLAGVKGEILDTIQLPLEHPELFAAGLRRSGLLFYGPPGTGKTLLAKAVATECSLNFLSVKGPELINMYVGQSEENIREGVTAGVRLPFIYLPKTIKVFTKARSAAPCVVFFDELDALAPNRGRSGDSGGVMDRVVSQLLAELDGLHKSCDVFVIGATNRPDLLDPALLRPGRFDKLLYLGVSETREDQLNIVKALTRKFTLADDCHLDSIISQCSFNLTGADFYALCTDAVLNAIKTKISLLEAGEDEVEETLEVTGEDFSSALRCLVPSVSEQELQNYKKLQCSLATPMSKTL